MRISSLISSFRLTSPFPIAVHVHFPCHWLCRTPKKVEVRPPVQALKEEVRTAGSLWAGETSRNSLFVDTRARGVGDIVTIRVSENSKGSKSAATDTSRKSSTAAGITDFFGASQDLGLDKLYGGVGFRPSVAADSSSSFKGDGNTSRSSLLEADITARVIEVLPNGNLSIEGRREIVVNNEEQIMVLGGSSDLKISPLQTLSFPPMLMLG